MPKRTFQVMSTVYHRPGWVDCQEFQAVDHANAAEMWAEEEDQMGDYSILNKGSHGPVLVRELGSEEVKKFNISAEASPIYFAREIEEA